VASTTNLEVLRTVRAISIDLDHAVAYYETYVPSGQDAALIDRINKVKYYPAFNVVSAAGHPMDPNKLSKWLDEVAAVSKSDELAALKRARHRAIAHRATPNQPYTGKARITKYGDERAIIEKTIPLVEEAGEFVGYSYVSPYADQRQVRRGHATKFWASVAAS
jgi:hypothetical protein